MDNNIEKVIFPKNNRVDICKFYYDDIGLYSISIVKDAKSTTMFITSELYNLKKNSKYMTIMDGTGGLGGNSISFCFAFKQVLVYEINSDRFSYLKKNMANYKFNNYQLFNNNCLKNLNSNIDIYFFDPPWGGPDYKNEEVIRLNLDNKSLLNIIIDIKKINSDSFICFKLPYNYDLSEFSEYKYKIHKIRHSMIVLIFP